MYQGNNKTALSSQHSIAEAMINHLKTMPYNSIRISSLCQEADVSRQTFYSLFSTKDNVIRYILEYNYKFVPDGNQEASTMTLYDFCSNFVDYIENKKDILRLLCKNKIMLKFHKYLYSVFIDHPFIGGDVVTGDEAERAFKLELIAQYWASALTGFANVECREDNSLPREKLIQMLMTLVSGDYTAKRFRAPENKNNV